MIQAEQAGGQFLVQVLPVRYLPSTQEVQDLEPNSKLHVKQGYLQPLNTQVFLAESKSYPSLQPQP